MDSVLSNASPGVSRTAAPARVANRVISYAMLPRLAVFAAMTPSTEPLLIEETSR